MSKPEAISVILITKNCAKPLTECLESLKNFLRPKDGDEVIIVDTGSSDNTIELAERSGARVLRHPELNVAGMLDLVKTHLPDEFKKCADDSQFQDGFLSDFAAARQIATDAAKNDLVFWIDSDDVLTGGAALRDYASTYFTDPAHTVLFLSYDYSFDADGKCNTVLWRERILRKSLYHWAGVCHESMVPNDGKQVAAVRLPPETSRIIHKHGRHHLYSDIRNYAILRDAWEKAAWKDPRWEYYLGNACRGLSRWKEAINWYCKVLRRSGSREDRLSCALNIGYCHILFGRAWKAIDWFFQAVKIDPDDPRSFYGIARAYYELKRYPEVLQFSQLGAALGRPADQLTSVDPNAFDYYPGVFECLALRELKQVAPAVSKAREIAALRPNLPATQELVNDTLAWARRQTLLEAVGTVASTAFSGEAVVDLIQCIKPEIRKSIPELQIESYVPSSKQRTVTWLCGTTEEPWDPDSIETGVGGSEKMVILLSRELAARGYNVEVYGSPRPKNRNKTFSGVTYRPFEAFNPGLKRDIVICWRNYGLLSLSIRANTILFDMHDVADPMAFNADRLRPVSKVIFKSKFHLETAKNSVPADKALVLRNAIDPAHFDPPSISRDYKKIIYCSSADRGLKRALDIFSRAKQIHPDLSFHLFYGFTPLYVKRAAQVDYGFFGDEGAERHMLDYAEECFEMCDRVGAIFHGRVGHRELANELKSASIMLYPTSFPEISCMAAMEAQGAGCFPVVGNTGALVETVQHGLRLDAHDRDGFISAIDGIVNKGPDFDTKRAEMSQWALSAFALAPLVDQLIAQFCDAPLPTAKPRPILVS